MRILVTAATKHGSTADIAQVIASTLIGSGWSVDVRAPEEVETIAPYDAVILGSAVYAGHWLEAARTFVDRHQTALAARPVWLFSSGPVGDPPKPDTEAADIEPIRSRIGARGHRTFPGRIERDGLGLGERAIAALLRVTDRDDRPWGQIAAWATDIGRSLERAAAVTA